MMPAPPGWRVELIDGIGVVHPVDDLIVHELDGDDCACGPTLSPVKREDGSVGWVCVHHALDGRR